MMSTLKIIMMSTILLASSSTLATGTNFDKAFKVLLKYEGIQYHNNPKDPGGPTKFGITLKTFNRETQLNVSRETFKTLTAKDAKLYYRTFWWLRYGLQNIDSQKLSIALLMGMVNLGPNRPVRALQELLNDICDSHLDVDGIIGTNTIVAANMCDRADEGFPFYLHLKYIKDKRVEPVWRWAKNGLRNRVFHFEDEEDCE